MNERASKIPSILYKDVPSRWWINFCTSVSVCVYINRWTYARIMVAPGETCLSRLANWNRAAAPCLASRPEAFIEGINSTEKIERVQLERIDWGAGWIGWSCILLDHKGGSSERSRCIADLHRQSCFYGFRPTGGKELFCRFRISKFSFAFILSLRGGSGYPTDFSLKNRNEKNRSNEIVKILFLLIRVPDSLSIWFGSIYVEICSVFS